MQLRPEDIGFTHTSVEEAMNMLIAAFGYNKQLAYTLPPDLAEDIDRIGRLLCIDINAVLNAPQDEDSNVSHSSD